MDYSQLISENRIKHGKLTPKQIRDCLHLAARDIRTARKIAGDDPDWGYTIGYNAMLQAARALMFSKGYRAAGDRQHATTIQFVQIALGRKFSATIDFMDRIRRKRNRTVYDIAGLVSSKEADEVIKAAECFVDDIKKLLAPLINKK
jgi:uncharacterized protein (UPF0332 family)